MQSKNYFKSVIKDRASERTSESSIELAKREVETIFFLLDKFFDKKFESSNYKVVEIGCGDGYLKKFFEDRNFLYKGYDMDEIDIEKDPIKLDDNSVDLVINIGLIEALKNTENLISESKRILKKGGYFYTLTPNWLKSYKTFYNNPIHITPLTPISLTTLLKSMYNFEEVQVFPGLRCKPKWYYSGKFKFEKAFYLLPFNRYSHFKEKAYYYKNFFRDLIPEFLKGHSRSVISIAKK